MPDNDSAIWTSHKEVRDRVVEIDKLVSVHSALHERHSREIQQMNTTISSQFGKIEGTLESIQANQGSIIGEQSYRKGAINMLAWGVGMFFTIAGLAVAYWAVTSRVV